MHDAQDPQEIAKWDRWFGIECNNRAWRLSEMWTRTPAETDEMLNCAHAAALHWGKVGTEVHRARATMLLGHVHALVGSGALARRYAQAAFDYVTTHESPAWEVAFAHAVLSNASAASGESMLHARHYAAARRLAAALPPEERSLFEATMRVIPTPDRTIPMSR